MSTGHCPGHSWSASYDWGEGYSDSDKLPPHLVTAMFHFHLDIDVRELVGEGGDDKVFAGVQPLGLQEVVRAEGRMVHLDNHYGDNDYDNN